MGITDLGVLDGAKALGNLAKEYNRLDLYQQSVELMAKITDLAKANFELEQRLAEAEQQLALRDELVYEPAPEKSYHFYYRKLAEGRKDGPFCVRCYDAAGKLIRLTPWSDGRWQCSECAMAEVRARRGH